MFEKFAVKMIEEGKRIRKSFFSIAAQRQFIAPKIRLSDVDMRVNVIV